MKVVALIEAPDHVCYRYRIAAFADALAARCVELEAVPLARGLARIGQIWGLRHAGAVILQRKLLPAWQIRLLRHCARRLVYDVDDAVFQRDSYSGKSPASAGRERRFRATVRAADAVIAGNDYLRARALEALAGRARRAPKAADEEAAQRVQTIPTCIEPGPYRLARHTRKDAAVRLVWIGQPRTLLSLKRIGDHLAAIGEVLPGVELRVICSESVELPGVRVVLRPWSSQREAAELAEGDIGITWLPDDAWSQGKCGLRVLQFMAAGLPVVANPVGMNREQVRHGETGLLATTPAEWAAAVARLAAEPAWRARLGLAGRQVVEQQYSVASWGRRFAEAVAGACSERVDGSADRGGRAQRGAA